LGGAGSGDNEPARRGHRQRIRDADALALANRSIERAGGCTGLTRLGLDGCAW
jgi:hypothetical protein